MRAALVLVAAVALGCSGTSVGNPPGATADVHLGITGTTPPKPASVDVGGGIVLDVAWVAVREFDLAGEGTCGGGEDSEYDAPGAVAAELVASSVLPASPVWKRPANEAYCAFTAKLDKLDVAVPGAPADLVDHAVHVEGHRGDGTAFTAVADFGERFALGPADGSFTLGQGSVGLVLGFDLAAWFDPAALDAATTSGGVVVIDDQTNKDLYDALGERVPASAALYRDANRNGRVDGDDAANELGE